MKTFSRGLALAVIGAGLTVLPTAVAQAAPAPTGDSLLSQLQEQADGSVAVSKEVSTGKAGFIRTNGDLMPGNKATDRASAVAKADAYLDKYAAVLGARGDELTKVRTESGAFGWTVTYTQSYRGVPVFGSGIKANLDKQGDLTSITGYAAPGLDLSTTPRRSGAEASKAALAMVKAAPPTSADAKAADTTGLRASDASLVIYRKGSVKGEAGKAVLAWQVDVSNVTPNGGTIHDVLLLDSTSLKPVNRYSKIHEALNRTLYTVTDDGGTPDQVSDDTWAKVWSEGNALPGSLDQDQLNMLKSTEEIYNLYDNIAGRDSYDGKGANMVMVHNRADRCPNASWNGQYTSFCPGVYDDDTVGHEWSHAYTEYTSGLIYQWQSGALNESMSDVFGETQDLINAREDEGEGDLTAKRPDGLCSTHSPALPLLTINAPSSIARECLTGGASFGAPLTGTGITGDVIAPTDAVEEGGTNLDGCSSYDQDVTGKVVIVNRGLCSFEEKAAVATDEGAAALIIGNRDNAPLGMAGADQTLVSTVSIGLNDREAIRGALTAGGMVNVTMRDVGGDRFDSFRWLLSEKSSSFGGAIRDMWSPTCYGDPGKVSDAEYKCSTDDAGGVHSNSAVPNHAYALAVDGGAYNGQTVAGMGLDKAANIWWRTQSAYLTPVSDFTDLADGLQASCADLTGKPINKVTLGTDDVQPTAPVTASDCAELAKVIAATELRKEPVQCEFQPMLDPNTPSLCGDEFVNDVAWSEDFEDGLTGWTPSFELAYAGGIHEPWTASSAKHNSKYAFGPAPDQGQCVGGAGDFSSVDSIKSPVIQLDDNSLTPKLTFEHSVSTEVGYDGGNLKISVNGGAFKVVPASAYLFNGPTRLASEAEENTNPLAGQEGFTGTDGGTLESGWGTSIVDLAALDVAAGDLVQLRFDIGRDGCGGVLGWSVDNIQIVDCKLKTTIAATHKPEPSVFGEASTAEVTVARAGSAGAAPTGEVVVSDAAGKQLGTATLAKGAASVPLPATLAVGKHTLTATYAGDRTNASATVKFTATVAAAPGPGTEKSDSVTTMKVKPKKPKAGKKTTLVVKVKASDGSAVTGKVTIKLDGKKFRTVTVKNGKAKIVLKKGFSKGKHKLVASYAGTGTVSGSKAKLTIKVRR